MINETKFKAQKAYPIKQIKSYDNHSRKSKQKPHPNCVG